MDATEKLDRTARTVYERLVRALLTPIKNQTKVWKAMTQDDQDRLLAQFDDHLRTAVREAVDLVAADDMPHIKVTLAKVTFADEVQGTIKMANTDELRHRLADAANQIVILVVPDYEAHLKGERPRGDADQQVLDLGTDVAGTVNKGQEEIEREQREQAELAEKAARKDCYIRLLELGEDFSDWEVAQWSMEQLTEARAWAAAAMTAADPATIPDMPAFMRTTAGDEQP